MRVNAALVRGISKQLTSKERSQVKSSSTPEYPSKKPGFFTVVLVGKDPVEFIHAGGFEAAEAGRGGAAQRDTRQRQIKSPRGGDGLVR